MAEPKSCGLHTDLSKKKYQIVDWRYRTKTGIQGKHVVYFRSLRGKMSELQTSVPTPLFTATFKRRRASLLHASLQGLIFSRPPSRDFNHIETSSCEHESEA